MALLAGIPLSMNRIFVLNLLYMSILHPHCIQIPDIDSDSIFWQHAVCSLILTIMVMIITTVWKIISRFVMMIWMIISVGSLFVDDGLVDHHQGGDDHLDDLDDHQRGVIDRGEEGRISPPSHDTPSHCHCRHHHHRHLSLRHCPKHTPTLPLHANLGNFSLLKKGYNQFGQRGNVLLVNPILLLVILTMACYSNTIPR